MRTRVLRRPIVFFRFRCSILILLTRTVRCNIRSLQHIQLHTLCTLWHGVRFCFCYSLTSSGSYLGPKATPWRDCRRTQWRRWRFWAEAPWGTSKRLAQDSYHVVKFFFLLVLFHKNMNGRSVSVPGTKKWRWSATHFWILHEMDDFERPASSSRSCTYGRNCKTGWPLPTYKSLSLLAIIRLVAE